MATIPSEKPTAVAVEKVDGTSPETLIGAHPGTVAAEAVAQGQFQLTTGYEDLGVWQTIKHFKIASAICFLAALSAATDGYQISLIGNLIANKGFVQQFGTQTDADGSASLASTVLSLWASMGNLGQIIGMISQAFLSARYGRKASMFSLWLVIAIGCIIEVFSREWKSWLVAKLLGGIGVGCMQTTVPIYISEVAPTRVRGTFLMMYSVWWMTGQFLGTLALQILSKRDPMDYLTPVYTQFAQVGVMLIVYILLPESPSWLISRGKTEKARKALQFINRGVDGFDLDRQYTVALLTIQHEQQVAAEQKHEKWYAIFQGINGWRTIISCWCLMTQMFIGLGLFLTYGSYFFQQAGMDDPFMVICITSGINIAATIIIVWMSEARGMGRRRLATYGTTLCWVCNMAIGILGVVSLSAAVKVLLVLFAVFWNIGLMANGSVGWGFIGEISTQRLRHYTSGFAAASTCVVGMGMNFLIPPMINQNEWNWGLKTGFFFAGIGAFFTIATWFLIPETSGRSAAELDELFERKIKPWRFCHTETATQRLLEAEKSKV